MNQYLTAAAGSRVLSCRILALIATVALAFLCGRISGAASGTDQPTTGPLASDDGYRGIWYGVGPLKSEYRFKYSGGLATYPQQHAPIAVYSKEANKTFFVYGGTPKDNSTLLHMVSYFDHATGTVPRPAILLDKKTGDAHDNPTLSIDDKGYLWIFSNSHGGGRPAFISRSRQPYSIEAFDRVTSTSFSYGQPWFIPGRGFLFLHSRYFADTVQRKTYGRALYWMTSGDGFEWSKPQLLAKTDLGHYQVSWKDGERVGTAFNYHPRPIGLDARTNLFYAETADFGKTWKSAAAAALSPPFLTTCTAALVRDYQHEGLLVYLKDVQFDAGHRPVILFLTSKGATPGPEDGPRVWHTARWTGAKWEIRDFVKTLNNYDFGSLYIEPDGAWRIIAPTEPGPQPYNPGGEVAMWLSRDQGAKWEKVKDLTRGSQRNHGFIRRPLSAHPDFYAIWADGDGRKQSESFLYFTNRAGDHVWRLPAVMNGDSAKPEVAW